MTWLGKRIGLGLVKADTIATWRLQRRRGHWIATRTSIVETGAIRSAGS